MVRSSIQDKFERDIGKLGKHIKDNKTIYESLNESQKDYVDNIIFIAFSVFREMLKVIKELDSEHNTH